MKLLQRLLIFAAFLYAGILLYFIVFQESLLFFPDRQNFDDCGDMIHIHADARTDGDIRYYELRKKDSRATLVYFHGNGGSACGRASRIKLLSDALNVNVLIPEYPGFANDDTHPSQKAILENMSKFVEKTQASVSKPLFFLGVSLGSGVATFLSAKYEIDGLILVSPFYSVNKIGSERYPFVPISLLNRNPFPSHDWAKNVKEPVIIIHGSLDRIIPIHHGESLTREFRAAEFYEIEGARHNDMFSGFSSEVLPPMNQFIDRELKDNNN